jgi:hypothetical protein
MNEDRASGRFTFWPMETVEGAPPTDLVIGYPQFQPDFPTLVNRVSFDVPPIGATVWSIGYTDMEPKRISLEDLKTGKFNLLRDYRHKLKVVEGTVQRIFTQRFSAGFVEGAGRRERHSVSANSMRVPRFQRECPPLLGFSRRPRSSGERWAQ